MSKKKVKRRVAKFTLEPDGFSIHTFEMFRKLTRREYSEMKDWLYRTQEQMDQRGKVYKECEGKHVCLLYARYGVRMVLEHNNGEKFDTFFLRVKINPRKLIEPDSSYLGIFPPKKSSVKELKNAFQNLFSESVFPYDVNDYKLSRVDLCTNVRCDNSKLFREMVRVLRKLPASEPYKRVFHKEEDKRAENRYNKHYLRFVCGTHELTIYDKTYQMKENQLVLAYEKLPEGVLRFEAQCERAYLRAVEKKAGNPDTDELLWLLIQESKKRIIKHFSKCFPNTPFLQKEELRQRIEDSSIDSDTKELMLQLVMLLVRRQSVEKAMKELGIKEEEKSLLIDRFTELGISPIPLWTNFCAKRLPGPVELLRLVSEGELEIEYLKIKYK